MPVLLESLKADEDPASVIGTTCGESTNRLHLQIQIDDGILWILPQACGCAAGGFFNLQSSAIWKIIFEYAKFGIAQLCHCFVE